jgi:outer membrane protein TolC
VIFLGLEILPVTGQETRVELSLGDASQTTLSAPDSTRLPTTDSTTVQDDNWPGYQLPNSANIRDLSLEECIQLALENNRILKVYRLSEKSARINLKLAESRFLPSGYFSGGRDESRNDDLGYLIIKQVVSSSLGLSRALETGGAVSIGVSNSISESSNNSGVTNYNTGVGINVSQPLLNGAGLLVNRIPIDRAKTYATISLFSIKQNLTNLITSIESQYWDLILVYEDYKIQQEALQRTKELLEVNKSLIEAGRMASQEIVQAESDVASREISVANAENAIINTQISLQSQLDLPGRITIHPTTRMTFEETQVDQEECLQKAFNNRPDWQIHLKYLEIEEMNLIVAKNNNRYQLGLYGGISSNSTSITSLNTTFEEAFQFESLTWNVGLSFTFPFNREVLRNGVILQQLSRDRQALYVAELEDDIRIVVESAVRNVMYSLEQVKLAQRAKSLSEKKLILEEEKMKVGRSTNFQVISYQRDLTNAQNQELRNIATYLKALGTLEQTIGTTLLKWKIDLE